MHATYGATADSPIEPTARLRRYSSSYIAPTLIFIGAAGLLLWQLYRQRWFFHDDAFISLRYAVHLAKVGELTWNLGERVEGYTNFLQIMASAFLIKLGVAPVDAVRSINVGAAGGLILSTVYAARRLAPNDPLAVAIGSFLVAGSAPIALWILGGLEAVMLAAFVAASIAVIIPVFQSNDRPIIRSLISGLLVGLAYLTRPDAVIVGGIVMLNLCCFAPGDLRHRVRSAALHGAMTSVILLPHLLWRIHYYGDWLPNTFYAKVALPLLSRLVLGVHYDAIAMFLLPALPLAIVAIVRLTRTGGFSPAVCLLATTIAGYLLYVLWAGGDHMAGSRLLVPLIAPASLLVVTALTVERSSNWRAGFGIASVVAGTSAAAIFPQMRMDPAAFVGSLVGTYISENWPADALVALHTAGATPFFAPGLRFIDMLGLNDRNIARRTPVPILAPWQNVPGHAKGDGAYVLRRAPSYIIAGPAEGSLVSTPWFLSDVELRENPDFARCYTPETARIAYSASIALQGPDRPRPLIFTYYRRTCAPIRDISSQ